MLHIVCLSLDSDPTLIPNAAKHKGAFISEDIADIHEVHRAADPGDEASGGEGIDTHINSEKEHDKAIDADDDDDGRDPDDFSIMSEKQAKRIVSLCQWAFGVDLSVDVVVAEANVASLARRVMAARSLTRTSTSWSGTQVK